MPDTLTLPAIGAGSTTPVVSTDEVDVGVGNAHVQYVKLADGTPNGTDPLPGSTADGLLVNLGGNNDVTVAGVATAANQLPDGHNVTVDNASGGAAVNIQDGGNSITVDGTITANAGTGTFTVDGSGVTQPVSAATLPLPTGAATAALQLADGHNVAVASVTPATASGSITAAAMTVEIDVGGYAGLAVQTTGTWTGNYVIEGTVDGTNWVQTYGKSIQKDFLPVSDFNYNDAMHVLCGGLNKVRVRADTFSSGTLLVTFQANISPPMPHEYLGHIEDEVHAAGVGGILLGVRRDSDTSPVSGDNDNHFFVFDDAGRLKTRTILKPTTSGGTSIFKSLSIVNAAQSVKGTAGQVYGWYIFNAASTTLYLKIYNVASGSVVVGTTVPTLTVPVPARSATNVPWPHGIAFSTAISVAATTGIADNDSGAPAANDVSGGVFYA